MVDLPTHVSRRNVALVVVDNVAFLVGLTFMGTTTVLPTLIRLLGGSPVVIGLLGAIQTAGWHIPQLIAGRYVLNRSLVKAQVLVPAFVGRACLILFVPALLLSAGRAPGVALVALLAGMGAFFVSDAFSVVAWFELLAKVVPGAQRGRTLGVGQSLGSLAGAGAGLVVQAILARPQPFPTGYALLMLFSVASLSVGPLCLLFVHEPRAEPQGKAQPPWREFAPRLASILRTDPRFAWVTVISWASGLVDMAAAFYVLYATGPLRLAERTIGLFVTAGVVGGFLSGVLFGLLGDRKGPQQVIKVAMALRCLSPLLALAAPGLAGSWPAAVPWLFVTIFLLLGLINGAFSVGFLPYLLEIAPPGSSTVYGALFHTASALTLAAPMVGGWLVQVASHEVLFAVSLCLAVAGLGVALRGPAGAQRPAAAEEGLGL